jgi:hypothetical protein
VTVQVERYSVTITTATGGAGVGYTPGFTGRILAIIYQKAGSGGYSNNVTLSAALELSGEPVLSVPAGGMDASAVWYPRLEGSGEPIAAAADRLVLTIAAGGDLHVGTFLVVVG